LNVLFSLNAIVFLVLLVGLVASYAIYLVRRNQRYSIWESMLYGFASLFIRLLWRTSVENGEILSDSEWGGLVVANHRCSVDPFFVQAAAGRRVHWMVAGEYCRNPVSGPLLKLLQVIPTNRGGIDTKSTRKAISLAQEGRLVGMFPEGRINRTDQPLLSVRPGVALVAAKSNVPAIPVWIEGAPIGSSVAAPFLTPARVRIRVGRPITVPESQNGTPRDWIIAVMGEVARLGGHEDYPVALAGKKWT
jgi:1-acyl-sn-glycerol-3-phosphate acyltransferase